MPRTAFILAIVLGAPFAAISQTATPVFEFENHDGNVGGASPLSTSIRLGQPRTAITVPTTVDIQFFQVVSGWQGPNYTLQAYSDNTYTTPVGDALSLGTFTDAYGNAINIPSYSGIVNASVTGTFSQSLYYSFNFGCCDFSDEVAVKGDPANTFTCTQVGGNGSCYNGYYSGPPYLLVGTDVTNVIGLTQYESDGNTQIADGGASLTGIVTVAAMLRSNDGSLLQLQVEVEPAGVPFTGQSSTMSTAVGSGDIATISIPGLAYGAYHWQARAVDNEGGQSLWQSLSMNSTTTDFVIPVPQNVPYFLGNAGPQTSSVQQFRGYGSASYPVPLGGWQGSTSLSVWYVGAAFGCYNSGLTGIDVIQGTDPSMDNATTIYSTSAPLTDGGGFLYFYAPLALITGDSYQIVEKCSYNGTWLGFVNAFNSGGNAVGGIATDYATLSNALVGGTLPPNSGTISITTNSSAATFTVSGPAMFSGSGTSDTANNLPPGTYTITFGSVAGYITPSVQSQTLSLNGSIVFSGMYVPAAPMVRLSPPQVIFQSDNSTLSVRVTNTGNTDLQVTGTPYLAGANQKDFIVGTGSTCTNGTVVSPGQYCVVNIEYSPLTDSSESASLYLLDNASDSPQIAPLSGTLQASTPQITSILPNPIVGSSLSQSRQIIGTGFANGAVINWADLTKGRTGTITPIVDSPNVFSVPILSSDETATWQLQVINPGTSVSNCAAVSNSNGTTTMPCYSIQILSPDLPHSYGNDYPFQNAPYCTASTPASSCFADTDDHYGFFYRECTSFVAWRMNRDLGTPDPHSPSFFNAMGNGSWGAAHHWNANALALGYVVNNNPEIGAIAQWVSGCGGNCSSGHVAYVEKVNGDGTIDVSEYNYAGDDNKVSGEAGDHQFGIRTISAASTNLVFIHIRQMLLRATGFTSGVWAFGNQLIGIPNSEVLSISNPQSISITIASATIAGANNADFAVSSNSCSTDIPPYGACTITVIFTPSAVGSRNSKLTIKGTAGTQILSLVGTGVGPLTVSQTLSLGSVALGDANQKNVSLNNKTGADLNITKIVTGSNEFAESDTCGSVLSYKSSCTIKIVFSPVGIGARSSALTINDSATNSPQTVNLSGAGIVPVQISPASIAFGTLAVGKTSALKSIQIKNDSVESLAITGISWVGANPGDFHVSSSTCSVALAEGATCSLGVAFVPTAAGVRQAVLQLTDGAITSPQTVSVSGTGK